MPRLVVTTRAGERRMVDAECGLSIMEAIREAGIDELLALCGGCCSCATCHIHVDPAWMGALPPIDPDENELLAGIADESPYSRLSCQITLTPMLDGLPVTIAAHD